MLDTYPFGSEEDNLLSNYMMSLPIQELVDTIDQADTIAVFGHAHPDGDCIGSCLTMIGLLENLGKKVSCYVPDSPAPLFSFLTDINKVQTDFPYDPEVDLCIFVDCADHKRVGTTWTDRPDYFEKRTVVVIDHHISNPGFGDLNIVDPQASSTCELLTEIIDTHYPDQFNADISTALFMGISTDTGNFAYENTPSRTFSAATTVLEQGAKKELVIKQIYRNNSRETVTFIGTLINRIQQTGPIIYSRYTDTEVIEQGIDQEGVADKFLHLFSSIQHDGAFLLFKCIETEDNPHLRCSRRAKHPNIDVAQAAGYFGGGGHQHAAGMRVELSGASYQEAIKQSVTKAAELISAQQ